jgi:hypothetical protein
MSIKKFIVVLVCDTDPIVEQHALFKEQKKEWETTILVIKKLKDLLLPYESPQHQYPIITWFLRSDFGINSTCGNWCYPIKQYLTLWKQYEKDGDELGWHPHLGRINEKNEGYQECNDLQWINFNLKSGYNELSKIISIKSSRMGCGFHNNYTMNLLDSFGIEYDLSAYPNLENKKGIENIFNWKETAPHPYFPSKNNYKIQDKTSNEKLNILEIPISTIFVPWHLKLFWITNLKTANITINPILFKHFLKNLQQDSQRKIKFLIMYFHPSDLLNSYHFNHRQNTIQNFLVNINMIIKFAKQSDLDLNFMTAQQFGDFWKN